MKKIIKAISNNGIHLLASGFEKKTEKSTVMHWKSALNTRVFRHIERVGYMTVVLALLTPHASADDSAANLAKQLNNPVAALISVPFQWNYDKDMGPGEDGDRQLVNIQPVVPITLNEDWNIISRTILPLIKQDEIQPGTDQQGMGDVLQSVFLSPKAPTASGWIWGAGPALLLRTASDDLLGAEKWGAGPTAVLLKQQHGWTYGALTNHIWSYAGNGDRSDVDSTYLQPFLSFTTSALTTYGVNTESTYDWEANEWSVPINLMITQLFKLGGQPMSLQAGVRYWAESTEPGPEGWGARITYTLVFPR
jgi:hypothetical protein